MICHTTVLDHPNQTLTVEWDRDAAWNRKWLMVFNGVSGCRQVVRRPHPTENAIHHPNVRERSRHI